MDAEVRLYDYLFSKENPDETEEGKDYRSNLNPNSLEILNSAKLEPSLSAARPGNRYQFERTGYFCVDSRDSSNGSLVFNRTVSLRDSWAKIQRSSK